MSDVAPIQPESDDNEKTALYRHFDASGALLYVGISSNPTSRLGQHCGGSGWASQIASVTVEWHESREAALLAERGAIMAENPKFNLFRPGAPRANYSLVMPNPAQCRAGRALLGWSQDHLVEASKVTKSTIANFEGGKRQPFDRTLTDIRRALEGAGVIFIAENGEGPGVRLAKQKAE